VVPYQKPGPGAVTAIWEGFKSAMPDASTIREAAVVGLSTARQATTGLSSNLYREIKAMSSSELEQVMIKATRPDDTPVKGKHAERLVGVTYQVSSRYDLYDAVLRKLWSKMAEKDWRTTIKALYILHRFSADGAPEHAPALKARLRELRRTRDPKRKDKYFNSKQLLAGDSNPDNVKFRAFMSRYAHYVLLRAQCFGGAFDEIASAPVAPASKSENSKRTKSSSAAAGAAASAVARKPITSTSLRAEHLNAAEMLLKAGVVCQLKDGEECENTAIACERVASDMIGLTSAVAMALNRALNKSDGLTGADCALIRKWCVFYKEELLPQTKAMVKKASPKLDAFGLFLPSRMGTSVAPDVLEKGLALGDDSDDTAEETSVDAAITEVETADEPKTETKVDEAPEGQVEAAAPGPEDEVVDEEAEFDEEYEYEEEEYYDDEDL
jgi:ANTH domain